MINDGTYSYTWDGENRLITVQPKSALLTVGSKRIQSGYDYMGRRVRKVVSTYNGSSWTSLPDSDTRFVYDGWNVILELDGLDHDSNGQPDNAVIRKYTWGLDLSGSLQGAGGIGGLLAMNDTQGTVTTSDDKDYAYFYDTNGNVGQVIDVTASVLQPATLAARYEYDPYGQSLLDPSNAAVSGPYAATNPFRFSTKYCDSELATGTTEDLYYYGYRYYSPRLGRWVSRDPMGEKTGYNLYHMVENNAINHVDSDGRGVTEKTSALAAISSEMETHRGYLYYEDDVTGLRPLLNALNTDLIGWAPSDYTLNPNLGATQARFIGGWFSNDRLELGSLSPSSIAVVHEAVHLRNYLKGWHQQSGTGALIDDEGDANSIQEMIKPLIFLRRIEDHINNSGGHPNCQYVSNQWREFWRFTNSVVGFPWAASGVAGNLRVIDVWDVNAKHFFHLSCNQLAAEYNEMISVVFHAK